MVEPKKTGSKWARVTPQRVEDYTEGVKSPKKDWATEATAAEARYKDGVTKAATEGRWGRGIKSAGTEKWQKGAITKGPGRFQEGVTVAEDDYVKGFSPYADVINTIKLSPKYPKGDPRNFVRVQEIATALYKKRTGTTK